MEKVNASEKVEILKKKKWMPFERPLPNTAHWRGPLLQPLVVSCTYP
jgi:hypothetical protein